MSKFTRDCSVLATVLLLGSWLGAGVQAADTEPAVVTPALVSAAPPQDPAPAAIQEAEVPAALLAADPYDTISFPAGMTAEQISELLMRVFSQVRWELSQVGEKVLIAAWTEGDWVSRAYLRIEPGTVKVYHQATCGGKPAEQVGWIKKACISIRAKAKEPVQTGGLYLLFDRGLEGNTLEKQQQLNQLSDFFERDMVGRFKNAGREVIKIKSRNQFHPGPGKYLLMVATVQYNPGDKAARVMVGMGAGGLIYMKVEVRLFGDVPEPIFASKLDRGSIRDWPFVCRALSGDLVKKTSAALDARK
jgi:hypothetical protein